MSEPSKYVEVKQRTISEETLFEVYDAGLAFLAALDQPLSSILNGFGLPVTTTAAKRLAAFEDAVRRASWEEAAGTDNESPF